MAFPAPLATTPLPPLGMLLSPWSAVPFALMLLGIATLPLAAPRFWDSNRNKALRSVVLGLPVVLGMALEPVVVAHTAHEYAAFLLLLGALYVISGGIVVRGTLAGTPGLNTGLLATGAVLASLVGTTGASMLLIRPLLRANSIRRRKQHVVVFFIFVVANAGGLLTPLGDPPLFLGFLRGVPFLWTLRLAPAWLFVNGALLLLFFVVDSTVFRAEDLATPGDLDKVAVGHGVPLHIAGKRNVLYLAGAVAILVAAAHFRLPPGVQEAGLLLVAALSWFTTPRRLHVENGYTWHPIEEMAILFAGIFATMIPALQMLNARGAEFGLREP
jgi:Na+/H+ antiporter NhaD/arsenite permease-like protein